MARWHDALRAYRRRPLTGAPENELSNVMFVLCSESSAAAELVSAFEPALVLQTFGGARTPADAGTRATIEYAVRERGVRHVVVCGHHGCRAAASSGQGSREATQADAVAQCLALRRDEHLGALFRTHGVVLRALWLDEPEGDVYACDIEGRRARLMDDQDFAAMLTTFAPRAS